MLEMKDKNSSENNVSEGVKRDTWEPSCTSFGT